MMAKITVDAELLIELIDSDAAWAGSMHPDEMDEHRHRNDKLRRRAERALQREQEKKK